MAEDISWRLMTPPGYLPHPVAAEGREAVLRAFQEFADQYEVIELTVRSIVASENLAAVETNVVMRDRQSGNGGNVPVVALLNVRQGLITSIREYFDAASLRLHLAGIGIRPMPDEPESRAAPC
jgi:ketosteroid isomerase-like protein